MGKIGFCIQNTDTDIGDLTLAKTDISSDYLSLNTVAYSNMTKTLAEITNNEYKDSSNSLLFNPEDKDTLKPWGNAKIEFPEYKLSTGGPLTLADKRSIIIPKKDPTGYYFPLPCKYVYTKSGSYYFKWLEPEGQIPGIYKVASPTATAGTDLISTDFGLNLMLQGGGAGGSGCIYANKFNGASLIHAGAGGGSGAFMFVYINVKALSNGITVVIDEQQGEGSASEIYLHSASLPSAANPGADISIKNSLNNNMICRAFGGESAANFSQTVTWLGGSGGTYAYDTQIPDILHVYFAYTGGSGGNGNYLGGFSGGPYINPGTAGDTISSVLITPTDANWPFSEELELRTDYGQPYPINARSVAGDTVWYCSGGGGGGSACGTLFTDQITISGYGYGGAGAGTAKQYWHDTDTYEANYTAKGIDGGPGAFAICFSLTDQA